MLSPETVVMRAEESQPELCALADRFGIRRQALSDELTVDWSLTLCDGRLSLSHTRESELQNIRPEFSESRRARPAALAHERLIRAIGGLAPEKLHIVDATAGLGGDALLMASAGHQVTLIERSAALAAMLQHAINGCDLDFSLRHGESTNVLPKLIGQMRPDVIYLDPMFPVTGKRAKARKGLQALKELLPPSDDEHRLLETALDAAHYRVVVKRPIKAEPLAGRAPGFSYRGKLVRFDCYGLRKLS